MKFVVSLLLIVTSFASMSQNQLTIHPDQGKHTISKHIYGHFAEHLGKCIYGGFYVGEGNKIPNTQGVRNDIVDALKKLNIPNLRWPGGCFADTYHWKDGIGPKDKRPTIVNRWWGNVTEDNSFGTHDFLNMCELLNTEPYVSVNVGSGTVQEVADWVQYVNFDGVSPMSNLRNVNGRQKPWNVKYWGIGNEAWGCGGNMTAEYYANVYRQYATFMTGWSNSEKIFRIASGANSADYHWTEVLMKNIPHGMLDGLALHHYSVIDWGKKGPATGFTEEQYMKTMIQALKMDELITRHSEIMDQTDPKKRIALVVDEWGGWYDVEQGTNPGFLYQQNSMRDAVLAGATLNIFHKHCERVRMANLAQTVNVLQAVILTEGEKMILTPTYHVMDMYKVHHEATMLPIEVTSRDYALGSDKIAGLSASASRDAKGSVHISIVNIDARQAQSVTVNLKGVNVKNTTGQILTSAKLSDHNTFEKPNLIAPKSFQDFKVTGENLTVNIPPFSVVVLEVK
ncbi:MAG TPA: alpha-N-arabinofuranosidase [Chryseosolibacter sp.]